MPIYDKPLTARRSGLHPLLSRRRSHRLGALAKGARHKGLTVRRFDVKGRIRHRDLDRDALKVLRRLTRHGYAAYLVGGCVRDLLLGAVPKDFDIATDARPRQIKRLFRNSRIIGRRFRLVHITFADKALEISTFRAKAVQAIDADDLLIRHDNTFGTLEEDAERRDFTINGLFYDPDNNVVIDCVGGMADLELGRVRTIGEPWVRYQEDPVRMLRAIKFAGRLGLRISVESYRALLDCRDEIRKAAVPRLLEEILRLMNRGGALRSMRLLFKTGLMDILLPEIAESIHEELAAGRQSKFWAVMEELDRYVTSGNEPSSGFLVACLFSARFAPFLFDDDDEAGARRNASLVRAIEGTLRPVSLRLHMPKRDVYRAKQIFIAQWRLTAPARKSKRRGSTAQLLGREYFPESYLFLKLWSRATGERTEWVTAWDERMAEHGFSLNPRSRGRPARRHR